MEDESLADMAVPVIPIVTSGELVVGMRNPGFGEGGAHGAVVLQQEVFHAAVHSDGRESP